MERLSWYQSSLSTLRLFEEYKEGVRAVAVKISGLISCESVVVVWQQAIVVRKKGEATRTRRRRRIGLNSTKKIWRNKRSLKKVRCLLKCCCCCVWILIGTWVVLECKLLYAVVVTRIDFLGCCQSECNRVKVEEKAGVAAERRRTHLKRLVQQVCGNFTENKSHCCLKSNVLIDSSVCVVVWERK